MIGILEYVMNMLRILANEREDPQDGEERIVPSRADPTPSCAPASLERRTLPARRDVRNDSGEDAAAPKPRWLTGTPPRPGRYFCRMKGNLDPEDEPPKEFRFDWDGETWYFAGRPIMKGMMVVGWWPLPDVEGKE